MIPILIAVMSIHSIAYIIIASGVAAYINKVTLPENIPTVYGIMYGLNNFVTALTAKAVGFCTEQFGYQSLPSFVIVCSLLCLVGNFQLFWLTKHRSINWFLILFFLDKFIGFCIFITQKYFLILLICLTKINDKDVQV